MLRTLERFQRLLGKRPEIQSDSRLLETWAETHGHTLKRVRRGDGRVVEFDCDGCPGRMEWGPPQRNYVAGRELRVRIEAGLPNNLDMLIMSRQLAQKLETQAYQTLVRDHQTGIDATLPEEVRWLSMLEKLEVPSTAAGFVLLASSPPHGHRWLEGELLSRISRAASLWLSSDAPLVLMTLRGRVYLRTEALSMEDGLLDGARGLAEAAAISARHLIGKSMDGERAVQSRQHNKALALDEPSVLEMEMDSDIMALGMPSVIGPRADISA